MDDSAMYTGVDQGGVFGNLVKEEATQRLLDEQKKQIAELTPKLKDIVDMIDKEITLVSSIDRFVTAASLPEKDIRSELQAAALYKEYLDNLKTKFVIVLNEVKKR